MDLELVVRGGALDGKVFPLTQGMTHTIGRMPQCEIQIEDEAVSRKHCALQTLNGEVLVTDLRSANGTFVNEARIEATRIMPGDQLRIGSTVLECRTAAARRAAPSVTLEMADEEDTGRTTVIRKRFDPGKLEWLAQQPAQEKEGEVLTRAQRYLATVHHVSDQLSRARDVEGLFESIVSSVLDVTSADRAALLLRRESPAGQQVELAAARTRPGPTAQGHFGVSRTVVNDVLNKGVSTHTHDAVADERYASGESVILQQIRSVMCAPLRTTETILGALYVDSHSTSTFSEADLELLAASGNQAGIALHRARLLADLERLFLDMVRTIAATIDAKDGYTHRHSERVAAFSERLGVALGLSKNELEIVELSALLHDVGKIGVPDSILNKPGKLTSEEFEEMKRHPVHGARILSNIQSTRVSALLPGVKYHHERWDGSGYPDGLKGHDIPLLGRLLGVADFLDALTSARSYRGPMTLDQTIEMIQEGAGVHFDPVIADAAIALHGRGELVLPHAPGPALA
jgi:HD-GYP domain-containing protein (c-di-GMP phosphodiesterase class II)